MNKAKVAVYLRGMERAVVVDADRVEQKDGFVCAYNGGELVGMFDTGSIITLYRSENKNGN